MDIHVTINACFSMASYSLVLAIYVKTLFSSAKLQFTLLYMYSKHQRVEAKALRE